MLGLTARTLPGLVGDAAGGVLYAASLYLLVVLVAPTLPALLAGFLAAAIGVVVEAAQLTAGPSVLAQVFPPARLIFGTTFAPLDLVWAVVGALLASVLDAAADGALRRRRERSGSLPTAERR